MRKFIAKNKKTTSIIFILTCALVAIFSSVLKLPSGLAADCTNNGSNSICTSLEADIEGASDGDTITIPYNAGNTTYDLNLTSNLNIPAGVTVTCTKNGGQPATTLDVDGEIILNGSTTIQGCILKRADEGNLLQVNGTGVTITDNTIQALNENSSNHVIYDSSESDLSDLTISDNTISNLGNVMPEVMDLSDDSSSNSNPVTISGNTFTFNFTKLLVNDIQYLNFQNNTVHNSTTKTSCDSSGTNCLNGISSVAIYTNATNNGAGSVTGNTFKYLQYAYQDATTNTTDYDFKTNTFENNIEAIKITSANHNFGGNNTFKNKFLQNGTGITTSTTQYDINLGTSNTTFNLSYNYWGDANGITNTSSRINKGSNVFYVNPYYTNSGLTTLVNTLFRLNPSGANTGYGTFAEALTAASNGDTIRADSNIPENIDINKEIIVACNGTTISGTLAISAANSHGTSATVKDCTISNQITISGVDAKLQNNTITYDHASNFAVTTTNASNTVTIGGSGQGNTIESRNAIQANSAADGTITITHNTIGNANQYNQEGIQGLASNLVITNNVFTTDQAQASSGHYAIQVGDGSNSITSANLASNNIASTANDKGYHKGIIVGHGSTTIGTLTLTSNTINLTKTGLYINKTPNSVVPSNNVITNSVTDIANNQDGSSTIFNLAKTWDGNNNKPTDVNNTALFVLSPWCTAANCSTYSGEISATVSSATKSYAHTDAATAFNEADQNSTVTLVDSASGGNYSFTNITNTGITVNCDGSSDSIIESNLNLTTAGHTFNNCKFTGTVNVQSSATGITFNNATFEKTLSFEAPLTVTNSSFSIGVADDTALHNTTSDIAGSLIKNNTFAPNSVANLSAIVLEGANSGTVTVEDNTISGDVIMGIKGVNGILAVKDNILSTTDTTSTGIELRGSGNHVLGVDGDNGQQNTATGFGKALSLISASGNIKVYEDAYTTNTKGIVIASNGSGNVDLDLKNVTISSNTHTGIENNDAGSDINVLNSTLSSNTTYGINSTVDDILTVAGSTLNNNGTAINVINNTNVAIGTTKLTNSGTSALTTSDNSNTLDAKNNWWDHATGPNDPRYSGVGSGDAIVNPSSKILYSPFKTAANLSGSDGRLIIQNDAEAAQHYLTTLSEATSQATAGETILVKTNISEAITLATADVSLKCDSTSRQITNTVTVTASGPANSNYLTIDSCTFTQPISITSGADNVKVTSSIIAMADNNEIAFTVTGANGNTNDNIWLHSNLIKHGAGNVTIDKAFNLGAHLGSIKLESNTVYVDSSNGAQVDNCIVASSGNLTLTSNTCLSTSASGKGIDLSGTATLTSATGNTINTFTDGLYVNNNQTHSFSSNILKNNTDHVEINQADKNLSILNNFIGTATGPENGTIEETGNNSKIFYYPYYTDENRTTLATVRATRAITVNSENITANYQTIAAAVNIADVGNTIVVKSMTHTANLTINKAVTLDCEANTTLNNTVALSAAATIKDCKIQQTVTASSNGVTIDNVDFELANGDTGIVTSGDAHGLTINNGTTFTHQSSNTNINAIEIASGVSATSNITIDNITISGSVAKGIQIASGATRIKNANISTTANNGTDAGITITGSAATHKLGDDSDSNNKNQISGFDIGLHINGATGTHEVDHDQYNTNAKGIVIASNGGGNVDLDLTSVTISSNTHTGIENNDAGSDINVLNSTLNSNTTYGINSTVDDTLTVAGSTLDSNGTAINLANNTNVAIGTTKLTNNTTSALTTADGSNNLDAKNNWWDHATGPNDPNYTGVGSGDAIVNPSSRILYSPFKTAANLSGSDGRFIIQNDNAQAQHYLTTLAEAQSEATAGETILVKTNISSAITLSAADVSFKCDSTSREISNTLTITASGAGASNYLEVGSCTFKQPISITSGADNVKVTGNTIAMADDSEIAISVVGADGNTNNNIWLHSNLIKHGTGAVTIDKAFNLGAFLGSIKLESNTVYVAANTAAQVDHCIVATSGNLTLTNNTCYSTSASGKGIDLSSTATLTSATGNILDAFTVGIYVNNGVSHTFTSNIIRNNTKSAQIAATNTSLILKQNWWDAANGPAGNKLVEASGSKIYTYPHYTNENRTTLATIVATREPSGVNHGFGTIADAITNAVSGETVQISASQTNAEAIDLVTSNKQLTLTCANKANTILTNTIKLSTNSTLQSCTLENKTTLAGNNITVNNNNYRPLSNNTAIDNTGDTHSLTISNNSFTNKAGQSGFTGIVINNQVSSAGSSSITSNTFTGTTTKAIDISSGQFTINGNTITRDAYSAGTYGIVLKGSTDNHSIGNSSSNSITNLENGLLINGLTGTLTVAANTISDNLINIKVLENGSGNVVINISNLTSNGANIASDTGISNADPGSTINVSGTSELQNLTTAISSTVADNWTIDANIHDNTTGINLGGNTSVAISGSQIVDNTTGIATSTHSGISVATTTFSGNTTAINASGNDADLNAKNNWWGHADGPNDPNYTGQFTNGQSITDPNTRILYSPFKTAVNLTGADARILIKDSGNNITNYENRIADAITNANSNGDIIFLKANLDENITIANADITLDCNSKELTGTTNFNSNGDSTSDYAELKNCTVKNTLTLTDNNFAKIHTNTFNLAQNLIAITASGNNNLLIDGNTIKHDEGAGALDTAISLGANMGATVTIQNNSIHKSNGVGTKIDKCMNIQSGTVTLSSNTCFSTENNGNGITVSNSANLASSSNTIKGFTNGMYITNTADTAKTFTFSGDTFDNNSNAGIYANFGKGIQVRTSSFLNAGTYYSQIAATPQADIRQNWYGQATPVANKFVNTNYFRYYTSADKDTLVSSEAIINPSESTPQHYATVEEALTAAQANDIVRVLNNTHANLTIAANNITIQCESKNNGILNSATLSGSSNTIKDCTLNNMTITGLNNTVQDSALTNLTVSGITNTIKDSTIDNLTTTGNSTSIQGMTFSGTNAAKPNIKASNVAAVSITGNTFNGNSTDAISLDTVTEATISNNNMANKDYLKNVNVLNSGATLANNTFSSNTAGSGVGVYINNTTQSVTLSTDNISKKDIAVDVVKGSLTSTSATINTNTTGYNIQSGNTKAINVSSGTITENTTAIKNAGSGLITLNRNKISHTSPTNKKSIENTHKTQKIKLTANFVSPGYRKNGLVKIDSKLTSDNNIAGQNAKSNNEVASTNGKVQISENNVIFVENNKISSLTKDTTKTVSEDKKFQIDNVEFDLRNITITKNDGQTKAANLLNKRILGETQNFTNAVQFTNDLSEDKIQIINEDFSDIKIEIPNNTLMFTEANFTEFKLLKATNIEGLHSENIVTNKAIKFGDENGTVAFDKEITITFEDTTSNHWVVQKSDGEPFYSFGTCTKQAIPAGADQCYYTDGNDTIVVIDHATVVAPANQAGANPVFATSHYTPKKSNTIDTLKPTQSNKTRITSRNFSLKETEGKVTQNLRYDFKDQNVKIQFAKNTTIKANKEKFTQSLNFKIQQYPNIKFRDRKHNAFYLIEFHKLIPRFEASKKVTVSFEIFEWMKPKGIKLYTKNEKNEYLPLKAKLSFDKASQTMSFKTKELTPILISYKSQVYKSALIPNKHWYSKYMNAGFENQTLDPSIQADVKLSRAQVADSLFKALDVQGDKQYTHKFKDLKNHPNERAIAYLKSINVIKGYKDGTFKPEQEISRAETLKIILEALDYKLTNGDTKLSDTTQKDWFNQYIFTGIDQGIINGFPDGSFKPHQNVNHAEFAKILYLANQAK